MSLQAGTRIGSYDILAPLGAGGMGEVYRARDTRLGRDVAIKVLPSGLAADAERVRRFEREARSASALNHPNIVTIHEVGSSGSISYIAMELVDGESLRALLLEGALPVRRLLQIGAQVAEGLAKAHASGIVHRDLKPENVMVTEEGHVKILDFGLAKLTQSDSGGEGRLPAPTISGATQEGVVVGTVGYMSPEQARSAPVDYRSDQFSFGCILYEMATGRRAFQRASAPQTQAAIIQDEPEPIAAQNPRVPAPLRLTVLRCLAKEARNRYASTEDLARELATIRDNLSEVSSPAGVLAEEPVSPSRRRSWILAAIAAAILLTLGIVGWRLRESDYFWKNPLAGARFTRLTDWEGSEVDAAISSDGKFVAFLSDRVGPFEAWVMQVGSDEAINVSKGRMRELYAPYIRNLGFASDDSHVWIRVSALPGGQDSGVSWLVPTMGGNPRPFLPFALSIDWSPDRARLVYNGGQPGSPLYVADRNGANEKQILIDKPGMRNNFPVWSPDGRFIYFVRGQTALFDMDIWRIPSRGGVIERLTNYHARVAYPAFLDERTLLYTAPRPDGSGSGLYAMDIDRRIPHAVSFGLEEYVSVAASADGRRLVATVANPTSHLWSAPITDHVVDEGAVSRFSLPAVRAAAPRFGPDELLFLSSKGGANGLWRFKDGVATELWRGSEGMVAAAPAISHDGSRIGFVVRQEGRGHLYVMAADGTGSRRIGESLDARDGPSWSPDGKWIAVIASRDNAQPLFKIPVDGGEPVLLVGGFNSDPVWSPDGRFIVYSENQGGSAYRVKAVTPEKQPFRLPTAATSWPAQRIFSEGSVGTGGAHEPGIFRSEVTVRLGGNRYRFLPGGDALVLMLGGLREHDFWLLDLATGRHRRLTNLRPGYEMKSFDVSPDGKQILFDRYRENSDVVLIDLPPR
jgi:serine/threonine protein kinase/Tol biopolymer transport system component